MKCPVFMAWFMLYSVTILAQATTTEQRMMQLVRAYERAQDSVFERGRNIAKMQFLLQNVKETHQLYAVLVTEADSNTRLAAGYLNTAITWYAQVVQYNVLQDSASFAALQQLHTAADSIDQHDFPIRFKVLGLSIVLRYENIKPDLCLYYDCLAQAYVHQKNCDGLRYIVERYRQLADNNRVDQWKRANKKCRSKKWIGK